MGEETLPDEVCLTSFSMDGEIIAVDIVSLEQLQYGGVVIPYGVYGTAHLTPMSVH